MLSPREKTKTFPQLQTRAPKPSESRSGHVLNKSKNNQESMQSELRTNVFL